MKIHVTELGLTPECLDFFNKYSIEEAWNQCPSPIWMLEFGSKLNIDRRLLM